MFQASLCSSSGEQDVCYCTWCAALVLTVASCWFSISLHNLLTMHSHKNLKNILCSVCGSDTSLIFINFYFYIPRQYYERGHEPLFANPFHPTMIIIFPYHATLCRLNSAAETALVNKSRM